MVVVTRGSRCGVDVRHTGFYAQKRNSKFGKKRIFLEFPSFGANFVEIRDSGKSPGPKCQNPSRAEVKMGWMCKDTSLRTCFSVLNQPTKNRMKKFFLEKIDFQNLQLFSIMKVRPAGRGLTQSWLCVWHMYGCFPKRYSMFSQNPIDRILREHDISRSLEALVIGFRENFPKFQNRSNV